MNNIGNQLLEAITPLLLNLLIVLVSLVITAVISLLKKVRELIVNKVGTQNYNRDRDVAVGIYYLLEDDFKGVVNAGNEKRAIMEAKLLELFPTLTQIELDAINKEVWTMFDQKVRESGKLNPVQSGPLPEPVDQPEVPPESSEVITLHS